MARPPEGGRSRGNHGTRGGRGSGGRPPAQATYTPDYQSLIQNDPAFMALQQSLSAQQGQDEATRQGATDQALIGYGAVPDFSAVAAQLGLSPQEVQMLQQDVSPQIAGLAAANTGAGLSTTAQLQHGQDQAMLALRNNLAARGAISSGDDAYRTNQQNLAFNQAEATALQRLLGAIGGYQQTYLGNQQAEGQQLQQGVTTAEQFEAGLPQNQPGTLTYNAKTGKYHSSAGGTYTPHHTGNGWVLTSDQTGQSFSLGANGALTPVGAAPAPAPPPGASQPGPQGGSPAPPPHVPPPAPAPGPPPGAHTPGVQGGYAAQAPAQAAAAFHPAVAAVARAVAAFHNDPAVGNPWHSNFLQINRPTVQPRGIGNDENVIPQFHPAQPRGHVAPPGARGGRASLL